MDSTSFEQIQSFYETSWSHLMVFAIGLGAIAIFILGLIVPLVQRRSLQADEARLQRGFIQEIGNAKEYLEGKFKNDLEKAKTDLEKNYKDHIEEQTKSLKDQLELSINFVQALGYLSQGLASIANDRYDHGLSSFLNAFRFFLLANDYDSPAMENAFIAITLMNTEGKITQANLDSIQKSIGSSFEEYIETITKLDTSKKYEKKIQELKEKLLALKPSDPK